MTKPKSFIDDLAQMAFQKTFTEARSEGVCVKCKKSPSATNCPTEADRKEYKISGLCGTCYDGIFPHD